MSKTVYNRLKIVLAEKSVTNRALAQKLGKTEKTVSRWCTNDAQPTVEGLYEIAAFLKVTVSELLVPNKK